MPLVSVIMSVYNDERYVGSAIESILAQTFTDFEFIIIDDGSRDKTATIIKEYQKKDPRIIFLQNEKNIGLAASLNVGIERSTGQFISRQDADDISLVDRLKKQIEFLKDNPEYYLLGTAFLEIDESGTVICKQRTPLLTGDSEIRKNIVKFNPFCHGSVMLRKGALDAVGNYNKAYSYAQDYELWVRITRLFKVANLKDILLYRRVTKDMASIANLREQSVYAVKTKLFAVSLLKLPRFNYFYIFKDLLRVILPPFFINFVRSLRLRIKQKAGDIALLMLSILFTLAIFEVILRHTPLANYIVVQEKKDFPRYYYRIDETRGYDISENFPPKFHTFTDYKYKIWSNELGCFDKPYNNEAGYILLLGDSFIFGFSPFEYKFGTLLGNYLGKRVLQCGVIGYGTRQQLLKAQSIIGKTKNIPALLIIGYCAGNDLEDDYLFPRYTAFDGYLLDKCVLDNRSTGAKSVYPDDYLKEQVKKTLDSRIGNKPNRVSKNIKIWLSRHFVSYNIIKNVGFLRSLFARLGLLEAPASALPVSRSIASIDYESPDKFPWLKQAWEEHLNNLKRIKELADTYGAKLLVVVIPAKEQVYGDTNSPYGGGVANKIISRFCKEQGTACVDLTFAFQQYHQKQQKKNFYFKENKLYWRTDGHWNLKGNKFASLLVSQYIIDHGLVEVAGRGRKRKALENELKHFQ